MRYLYVELIFPVAMIVLLELSDVLFIHLLKEYHMPIT